MAVKVMCCKIHTSANLIFMCVTKTAAVFCTFAFENTSKNSEAGEKPW